jgi:guanidinopropionase
VTWALPDQAVLEVEQFYALLDAGVCVPFTIGGDHGITLPVLRAIAGPRSRRRAPLGMIHFDSHTDSYGLAMGMVCHAGSGFRLGALEGLIDPKRTVQVGLNGPLATFDQDNFSRDAGYRMIPLLEIQERGIKATVAEIRRVIGTGPGFPGFPRLSPGVGPPDGSRIPDPCYNSGKCVSFSSDGR